VNETPIVLEGIFSRARWSRLIIASTSFLFLLILSPVGSQTPSPRIDPRIFTTVPTRPPRRDTTISPTVPTPTPTISPVALSVSPLSVEVNEPVSLEVMLNPPPGLEVDYRFVFGDGKSESTKQRKTTHAYPSPGTYPVYADVQLRGRIFADRPFTTKTIGQTVDVKPKANQQPPITPPPLPPPTGPIAVTTVAPSVPPTPPVTPTITPPPPSIPWIYVVLGGLVVVTLGYLLRRKPKPKPMPARPTFHPQWDPGTPQTKQPENVSINYELHFDPNLSKGQHRLETDGASLIISRKEKQ
jgi:hypothetical protein